MAWQTARTNRVLDDLLAVAVEESDQTDRRDSKQIEKTSEVSVITSFILGDSNE